MKNALRDLLPRKVRLGLYVGASAVALGIAAWQASEGNVLTFLASLAVSASNVLAAGNTDTGGEG